MRRIWLAAALLAVALVVQLTVIDGLDLPHGGEPDLVLVLVVALAMAGGPVPGMVTGFAAGLCVDIAPPGAPLIGQYALVFCLAGWAAGSLGRLTRRSPLRALAVAAIVIAAAETMVAGLGKALEPDQVSVAEIRQFLPVTIAYDLIICPFALYLVILVATSSASRGVADSALAGTGLLSVSARSKQAERKRRTHIPRLDPAAARRRDGRIGGGPGMHPGSKRSAQRGTRLHPGAGVAGSASGYAPPPAQLPARPVKLRLSAGGRRGVALGGSVGSGEGWHWQRGLHPGMLAGVSHQIRFTGELGGSAARQHVTAAPGPRPVRINFRGRLGGSAARQHPPAGPRPKPPRINFSAPGGGAAGRRHPPAGPRPKPLRINFSAHGGGATARQHPPAGPGPKPVRINFRGRLGGSAGRRQPPVARRPKPLRINFGAHSGGSIGGGTGTSRLTRPAVPRLRMGASRSALAKTTQIARARSVPSVDFRSAPVPVARRPAVTPKFRRSSRMFGTSALTTGLVAGGALDQRTFRTSRTGIGRRRVRLFGRGLGMLGGSGNSTVRRPPPRTRKQPRFGYGRRSPLTFLTKRRVGGKWLARRRAGRRSGAWLISKRTGGLR